MKKNNSHLLNGILIPLFSIRTEVSFGCGDFLSLIELGKWCVHAGINLIQILPVNDTGNDPSPYSAISAYALHPLFIRITALPEYTTVNSNIQKKIYPMLCKLQKYEEAERLIYHSVLNNKFGIAKILFQECYNHIIQMESFLNWIKNNEWVREYAVFRSIKDENEQKAWSEWTTYQTPSEKDIEDLWEKEIYIQSNLFYAWLQYRLESQFNEAVKELRNMGILLKGDIPILMNNDSVAVWRHRELFNLNFCAGAPPDMFSTLGQNWGFPIYNWRQLKKENYNWWRLRLKQAEKFYDAYRIDHVLGFFRIWATSHINNEGVLGYFHPAQYISRKELHNIGFNDERIYWLSEPHITYNDLEQMFTKYTHKIISYFFTRISNEDLYVFKDNVCGEKYIIDSPFEEDIKQKILSIFRDRVFIQISQDTFIETWFFRNCKRYTILGDNEKQNFENLLAYTHQKSEEMWESHGKQILLFMKEEVDMLCCAEDLGVIPHCVPKVLETLDILGLKVSRWERHYSLPHKPFISFMEYPYSTVCATSVHDTSTLREWWEYEDGREQFWREIGETSSCPPQYDVKVAEKVIKAHLKASSRIIIFQIQDLFAIEPSYRNVNARDERINIPGTIQENNWSYRIPMCISTLCSNKEYTKKLKNLFQTRYSFMQ